MAISATLFAMMNVLTRQATATASWTTAGAVRALVGALVAFTVARMRNRSLAPKDAQAIFWRSLLGTFSMISTFYALSSRTVSLGNTVTLLNLAPVFLALLAPIFLHERTSRAVALAIGLALTGVVLVVRPSFLFGVENAVAPAAREIAGGGPSAGVTLLVAVGGALSTSIAMMFLRRLGRTESPEVIAFHFSLFAAITLGVLSLFDLRVPSMRDAVCMLGAGLAAGFAQLAMTRAYSLENAARVGGVSYLSVVVSALLGVVVFGERPSGIAIAGMLLVVAGGILSISVGRRPITAPHKIQTLR